MGVGKGTAQRGELSATTTKLRLKQTPMTLFSSQTSDSFHFLNNKAFLWSEVRGLHLPGLTPLKLLQSPAERGLAGVQKAGVPHTRTKGQQDRRGEQPPRVRPTNSAGIWCQKEPQASS